MSVTAAFPASEELTPIPPPRSKHKKEPSPIPPPRRKRANSHSPKHRHNIPGVETSDSSSCSNKDSAAVKRSESLRPPQLQLSDVVSTTKKETSVAVTLLREEWMMKGSSRSLPRTQNYYTRDGLEMRRQVSAPQSTANTVVVSPLTSPLAESQNTTSSLATTTMSCNAVEEKKAVIAEEEESPTRSTRVSATRPTPKVHPSSQRRPNRPPKPPAPAPYHSTRNKTASYSQLYSGAADTQASSSSTKIVVIDSKAVADVGGERSLNMAPRTYGKMSGSRTKSGQGKKSNGDDTSIVYGKKTQAALNTLVAAMKRFQGSGQKTNPVRKSSTNKTPPKRPPPAVRNTPRPKFSSVENLSCATYSVDGNEDHTSVDSYADHIYMEVGEVIFKSNVVTGASAMARLQRVGQGVGLEEEDDEDDYVIMNPDDDSHIYTPLAFHTSNSAGG